MTSRLSILDKVFVGLLLVVFGGVVLHAPLSVGIGTLLPEFDLVIKAWKEILLGIASILALAIVIRQKKWTIYASPLFYLIGGYAALHLLLIAPFFTGVEATVAGLLIDLRYILLFVLIYTAVALYPQLRRSFIATGIIGALIVTVFAILQVTVLPHDVLKYIGYGEATIAPFLTVDQNMEYIRINSTLRGPNPLGAYAVIVLALLLAFWLKGNHKTVRRPMGGALILLIGGAIALWASYSRSALLAAVVALGIVLFVVLGKRISKAVWIGLAVVALAIGGSIIAFRESDLVSHVILHEDPNEGNDVNSNDGHLESLIEGGGRTLAQPLGAGIGSTGSASLLSDEPFIVENQYFFVAHETGWLGLILFVGIFGLILYQLWRRRGDWLAVGVFASGLGLACIGVLLPVWVDDTVSLVWWGMAAIVIASSTFGKSKRKS